MLLFEVFLTPFPKEDMNDVALKKKAKASTQFKFVINIIKPHQNMLRNIVEAVQ